eukprot:GHVU01114637.1.p1 GENE.GHVU01114637.1~~GHVU01114637.1.p1  ORF type:complete len:116 (-),score=11.10 GHVU01114637.1:154-459(-)
MHSLFYRYDEYSVDPHGSREDKALKLDVLRENLATATTKARVYYQIPLAKAHTKHSLVKECGFSQRMDTKVKDKIYQYVKAGVTNATVLQKLLKKYVSEEL